MFAVIVQRAGALTWRKTFVSREITVGRDPANELVLRDPVVSPRHARIVLRSGKYILVDLKSTDGTHYDGRRVASPFVARELAPIAIGPYTLRIETIVPVPEEPAGPLLLRHDIEVQLIEDITRGEDSARLVYADWLEQHDDDIRAEFLRVQHSLIGMATDDPDFEATSGRLRELALSTDVPWRRSVAHARVEACAVAFDFKCPKRWTSLTPTERPEVRHCDACHKDVHYTTSPEIARAHAARGACVAFDVAAARWPGDLAEPFGVTMCRRCRIDHGGLDECPRCGESLPLLDENLETGMITP